ncbi:hypothetical protein BDF14DRAFT_1883547 [Spinellus fusiger]|nr:hypothetical protein BDF14DRAFT_1883547 [Spinellus fusiger]
MSRSIWSHTISPGERHRVDIEGTLCLTMATLLPTAKKGRSTLILEVNGIEYTLCSLITDKIENQACRIHLAEEDEATLSVSGVNTMALLGTLEVDSDFIPEEEELEDTHGSLQFRDPSDNTFLGGFELRHFGLAQQNSPLDAIDLRKEETSSEERALNDRIVTAILNGMKNTGKRREIKVADTLMEKLQKSTAETSSKLKK